MAREYRDKEDSDHDYQQIMVQVIPFMSRIVLLKSCDLQKGETARRGDWLDCIANSGTTIVYNRTLRLGIVP